MNKQMKKEIENICDAYDLQKYLTRKINEDVCLHKKANAFYSARQNILDALSSLVTAYKQCRLFLSPCVVDEPVFNYEKFNDVIDEVAALLAEVIKKADDSSFDHEASEDGLQLLFDEMYGVIGKKKEVENVR